MKGQYILRVAQAGLLVLALNGVAVFAQSTGAKTATASPGQAETAELNALLAKANSLYYSYEREGVTGFDCEVKPDWAEIFKSTTDSRIALMNTVAIRLHARTDGSSKVEWIDPPNPNDPNGLLGQMHSAMDQTLTGFMQFWMPFIHGEVIPQSTTGMQIHKTADGIVIHGEDGSVKLDEQLDNSLNLTHYDVTMQNQLVKFEPAYTPTANGLLVNYFLARLGPLNATPAQMQEMHVKIDYQLVQGVEIPQRLNMEVLGTGAVNATMSGCTVMKK